jgi:hypothetical protein
MGLPILLLIPIISLLVLGYLVITAPEHRGVK